MRYGVIFVYWFLLIMVLQRIWRAKFKVSIIIASNNGMNNDRMIQYLMRRNQKSDAKLPYFKCIVSLAKSHWYQSGSLFLLIVMKSALINKKFVGFDFIN